VLGEEAVMAGDRVHDRHALVARDEIGELVLEPEGVEAVARDAGDRDFGSDTGKRFGNAAPAPPDVVVVHRLRKHDVRVGVEPPGELVAVILEVRLDRVVPAFERMLVVLVAAVKPLLKLELRAVTHLPDATRDRHAPPRPFEKVVVVAAAKMRIGFDRADLQRAQRDLFGGRRRAARDHNCARHPIRVLDRPFQDALTAG
jgi:hypothetical protein